MRCQYNPALTRHAIYDAPELGHAVPATCEREATQKLGTTNVWYLCDEHAKLPIFTRLRKRERIDEGRRAA